MRFNQIMYGIQYAATHDVIEFMGSESGMMYHPRILAAICSHDTRAAHMEMEYHTRSLMAIVQDIDLKSSMQADTLQVK